MSTEQAGSDTWAATITCFEDGEALNENAMITELAIPIIDRTKYLYARNAEQEILRVVAWGVLLTDGGGGVSSLEGSGFASAAISGNAIRVTLSDAMTSTTAYGAHVSIPSDTAKIGNASPITTTTIDLYVLAATTGTVENLGAVIRRVFFTVYGRKA